MQKESRFLRLECIACGQKHPIHTHSRCSKCGGILTGCYDLAGSPISIEKRGTSIWQFRELLPPVSDENIVSLGEGWTPCIRATNYSKKVGVGNILCKLEGQNPTGSFKDRIGSTGLSLAKEWKKKGVFTASSGNAAAAISAYSARASIPCLVLIRDDSTIPKLGQILMYGARLLRVKDLFKTKDSLYNALDLTQRSLPEWLNHFVWAPLNPLLVDGLKTIAYEIASTVELPDYIFVPTAGGDVLYGIYKGFAELKTLGIVDRIPGMVVTQGKDSSPTVQAIESGATTVPETGKASTVAGALRVNFGGEHALVAVKESRGFGVALTDEEIIQAQRDAAKEDGIFCEVSSATALAGVAKALAQGRISKDTKVCAILTGAGFKDYTPPFHDISQVPLAESPEAIPRVLRSTRQTYA